MKLKQAAQQTEENALMQTMTYRSKEVKQKPQRNKTQKVNNIHKTCQSKTKFF